MLQTVSNLKVSSNPSDLNILDLTFLESDAFTCIIYYINRNTDLKPHVSGSPSRQVVWSLFVPFYTPSQDPVNGQPWMSLELLLWYVRVSPAQWHLYLLPLLQLANKKWGRYPPYQVLRDQGHPCSKYQDNQWHPSLILQPQAGLC